MYNQNDIADDCECTEEIGGIGCLVFLSLVLFIALGLLSSLIKWLLK
mgnify:FL=1